jgi:hypothetical protein
MLKFGGVDMMAGANNEATDFIRTYMTAAFYTAWRRQSWPGPVQRDLWPFTSRRRQAYSCIEPRAGSEGASVDPTETG